MTLPPPFGPELKVLVPAGRDEAPQAHRRARGSGEHPLADKAFACLHGRLVIEYVLEFLQECGYTRICVVAAEGQLARIPARHACTRVPQPPGAGLFETLTAGAAALAPAPGEPVLVVFGDHPVNSRVALHAFLTRCSSLLDRADFFHGLALQASYREYAPWFMRTSVHMREMSGRASGYSVAIPSRLHGLRAFRQLYRVRKQERLGSFLRLLVYIAGWLGSDAPRGLFDSGVAYLAKEMEKLGRGSGHSASGARRLELWLARRLPVRRLERYAARVLGAERGVRIVPVAHGGIAIDVDFAHELAVLERHWDDIRAIAARQDALLADAAGGS